MFQLLETLLCANGILQNVEIHQERVNKAIADLWGISQQAPLISSISIPGFCAKGRYRLRIVYAPEILSVEFVPDTARSWSKFSMIDGGEISYKHKYLDRSAINKLVELKGAADEIIIVKDGYITDCSIANLAFCAGGIWYTPAHCLLKGTMRESLLRKGIVCEAEIKARDICRYDSFTMINAIIGFNPLNAMPICNIINIEDFLLLQ
jgi:4-amino-4-deoxychorismate lyase